MKHLLPAALVVFLVFIKQANAQTAGLAAKQSVTISFDEARSRVLMQTNDLSPFVPLELKGTWPDSVYKLTIRLLNTKSNPSAEEFKKNIDAERPFKYGDVIAFTQDKIDGLVTRIDVDQLEG